MAFLCRLDVSQAQDRGILVNGVRPGVLLRLLKHEQGRAIPVPATYTFHSGDRLSLEIELAEDRFVYLLTQSIPSSGSRGGPFNMIHPMVPERDEALRGGITHRLPVNAVVRMNDQPGLERVVIVASRASVPDIRRRFEDSRRTTRGLGDFQTQLEDWIEKERAGTEWTGQRTKGLGIVTNTDGWYGAARPQGMPIVVDLVLNHNGR
jgi:hypothetical protein